jgi:hypothetical protein
MDGHRIKLTWGAAGASPLFYGALASGATAMALQAQSPAPYARTAEPDSPYHLHPDAHHPVPHWDVIGAVAGTAACVSWAGFKLAQQARFFLR